jgi:arylsulfatase A-like enzyme
MPDVITLPQYFKENSYQVMGHGKLFHQHDGDYPQSWDEYTWIWPNNVPEGRPGDWRIDGGPLDINDDEMADGKTAAWTARQLKKKYDKPFFLGVGIFRPHLDWFVPHKYFEMYPPEKVSLPEVNENDLDDIPPIGREIAESIGDYSTIKKYDQWRKAVVAYLACVSFADAMIGRVLDALEKSPYADNTIVVLWGDHGWHLGQKLHWRKFTLWEEGTKCPLIIYAPGITKPNSRCDRPVSLIDIYPTLVDICHLLPKSGLEGRSLKRLLKNPQAKWNNPALTTYGRNNHSLRSDRYRYIRYSDGTEELYDHKTDKYEWHNLAKNSEYSRIKKELVKWLPETNAPNAPDRKGNTDVKLWHIRFDHLRNREIKFDF